MTTQFYNSDFVDHVVLAHNGQALVTAARNDSMSSAGGEVGCSRLPYVAFTCVEVEVEQNYATVNPTTTG